MEKLHQGIAWFPVLRFMGMGVVSKLWKLISFIGMILLAMLAATTAAATVQAKLGCNKNMCGDLEIPYPFGLSEECCLDKMFYISCNNSDLTARTGTLRVRNISIEAHEMHVMAFVARDCYLDSGSPDFNASGYAWLRAGPFTISTTKNQFTVLGCDTRGVLTWKKNEETYSTGCISRCNDLNDAVNGSCSGLGCCSVEFPDGLNNYNVDVHSYKNHTDVWNFNPCGYAFVVQNGKFSFSTDYLKKGLDKRPPVVFDWAIGNKTCKDAERHPNYACLDPNSHCQDPKTRSGYQCKCKEGYKGNPYLPHGCQDINECEDATLNKCKRARDCINTEGSHTCRCPKWYHGDGTKDGEGCYPEFVLMIQIAIGAGVGFISMFVFSSWLYFALKKRKIMRLRENFFKQNGGFILQQRLGQQEGSKETVKIFTIDELKKATKNYDESRIIGRGGFGTVYKGFLLDSRIVAIKKSKIEDENQIEQFINEIVLLSQINHRHVVKLLGCCLETQVPLLVYEFVPKGTLFKYIHQENNASTLSWETRLRIVAEAAEALRYLHSAAIIHRDVKSTNILLDDDFTAKVSDFGTSRLVPRDQMQLATVVQGTLGYLDPEYLQTNQLTEKSDVYSFGVVLVEILTGKEALSFARSEEQRNLAMYFISSIKEERLLEILENHIVANGNKQQIQQFVELAKSCVAVKGEERPTMREVTTELERIRMMQKHPWVNLESNSEEGEQLLGETCEANKYGESSSTITSRYHHSMNIDHGTYALGDGR